MERATDGSVEVSHHIRVTPRLLRMIAERMETREPDALKNASQITYNLTEAITLYYDPGIDKPLIPKVKDAAKDSPTQARDEFQK